MATNATPDPIHLNPKNKGLLHKTLGIPLGEKIPVAKLQEAARSSDETVRKRAQFALNARKFKHAGASSTASHVSGDAEGPSEDGPGDEAESDRQAEAMSLETEKRNAEIRSHRPTARY